MKKHIQNSELKKDFEELLNSSFTKEECQIRGHYLTLKYESEKARALLDKKQFGTALKIFDPLAFNISFERWLIQENIKRDKK